MPLTREARSQLLALMPELGPEGRRVRFVAEARSQGPVLLDELAELPGVDQLRAAILRVLPDLAPDGIDDLLAGASQALAVYPEMARSDDPMLGIQRHPAWVGLATLELADLQGEDGLERALHLASAGFEGHEEAAPGEVLWAMAEAAEETGWTDRSGALLEAALDARFADEEGRGEVLLLLALRRAEDGHPDAPALLEQVLGTEGPTRRRVHAGWVLSALIRQDDPAGAIRVLAEALSLLDADPGTEPEVRARLVSALTDLGAPSAEA